MENKLKKIASLLRSVTYGISEAFDGGFNKGWSEGSEMAMGDLYLAITLDGERTNYSYAFSRMDLDLMPYGFPTPITPTGAIDRMFYYYYGYSLPNIDLSKVLANANCQALFSYSKLKTIRDVGLRAMNGYLNVFSNCANLVTIEKLRVKPSTEFVSTFKGCTSLKNITIGGDGDDFGYIGQNFDISYSPLSTASIVNIVEHLSDTSRATLTLNTDAVGKMTFPYKSPETKRTYNSWDELKQSKSGWTIKTTAWA